MSLVECSRAWPRCFARVAPLPRTLTDELARDGRCQTRERERQALDALVGEFEYEDDEDEPDSPKVRGEDRPRPSVTTGAGQRMQREAASGVAEDYAGRPCGRFPKHER